jgi:hypothetical protein
MIYGIDKQSLTYTTGNQMVTKSSSVLNTSTVFETTLKSIGKSIINRFWAIY